MVRHIFLAGFGYAGRDRAALIAVGLFRPGGLRHAGTGDLVHVPGLQLADMVGHILRRCRLRSDHIITYRAVFAFGDTGRHTGGGYSSVCCHRMRRCGKACRDSLIGGYVGVTAPGDEGIVIRGVRRFGLRGGRGCAAAVNDFFRFQRSTVFCLEGHGIDRFNAEGIGTRAAVGEFHTDQILGIRGKRGILHSELGATVAVVIGDDICRA